MIKNFSQSFPPRIRTKLRAGGMETQDLFSVCVFIGTLVGHFHNPGRVARFAIIAEANKFIIFIIILSEPEQHALKLNF